MNKNKFNKFEGLANIYNDKERSYERFEKGRMGIGRIFFFAVLFVGVISLALAAGYFVFREPQLKNFIDINKGEVTLEIKGNDQISSGEEVFYIIDYRNNSGDDIDNGEISLYLPEGFIADTMDPMPSDGKYNIWQIGKIKSQQGGQIKIKGILLGNAGEKKGLAAKIKYNPENTAAFFTRDAKTELFIKDIPLSLIIEGASDIEANKKNEINIKYANTSNSKLANLRLIAIYPQGNNFFINDKDVTNKENKYEWDVKELQAKEEGNLTAQILINSESKDSDIDVQIGYFTGDKFIFQQEEKKTFSIRKENFTAELSVNGAMDKLFLTGGEKLAYMLKLKNGGDKNIEDLKPRVFIDDNDRVLDWDSLEFQEKGKVDNNEIFWDKENLANLAKLEPGKEIELAFSISTKNNLADSPDNNIRNWAEITRTSSSTDEAVKSNLVEIKFNSALKLKVQARYFNENGEPLGSGPLPPQAGEKTTYKIFWQLSNNQSEIKDILVKAELPQNISWEENTTVDSGQLYFDQQKREILWTVPKLPGNLNKPVKGEFELGLQPTGDDIGKTMVLLKKTDLSGVEKVTGTEINLSGAALTTNLENDIIGSGKGVVLGNN